MKQEQVYLTFKTDRTTSELLKRLAQGMNMTQPELINRLCEIFIEDSLSHIHERLEEHSNNQ